MKPLYTITLLCLLFSFFCSAAPKYWVGPLNGNWSSLANWSDLPNGSGGAIIPSPVDSVIFANNVKALVHMDLSITIRAMLIQENVTLYASTDVVIVLTGSLNVTPFQTLKDSTSADVIFRFAFSGGTQSRSTIAGTWIFEGGVPVSQSVGKGASILTDPDTRLTVISLNLGSVNSGAIIFKKNTNYISASPSSLIFFAGSKYIIENNDNAAIPNATWAGDSLSNNGFIVLPGSSIRITGSMGKLTHSTSAHYRNIFIDLPNQVNDASLDLPNETVIDGDLSVANTNNHTLALLAAGSLALSVSAEVAGVLNVDGNTKVALASSALTSLTTSYKLKVLIYNQTGGNFSLQDYDNPLGASILSVTGNIIQTGGTFITNSSTTNPLAKFIVEMSGPQYSISRVSPDLHPRTQLIQMSSRTIDNTNHMVTLRMTQDLHLAISSIDRAGADLQTPLQVGKLELLSGTLNTSAANIITVMNPDPLSAITVGTTNSSYVNGPIRRWTRSGVPYSFPTGTGNRVLSPKSHFCSIVPASDEPSLYQAEYFGTGYSAVNVISPLKGISNTEYWNVSKISGADAKVQLALNALVAGATNSDAYVTARYINGHWTAENGSVLSLVNAVTGLVTSKVLSEFGPFTFGYANPGELDQTPLNGLSYKYYEGLFNALPDFNTLTPVKTGNSTNIDLGIRRSGVNDSFAIIWEGYITIPTAGTYTFETISDDGSKLYFNSPNITNGVALVNNDGVHPSRSASGTLNISAAGRYPITISFFENSGAEEMQLFWTGPGIERQHIPDAAFREGTPPPNGGLNYKYYEGDFSALPDFSTLTPIKIGKSSNVDISVKPVGVSDHFAFVWEGYIRIPTPGTYTFETVSDDGSKLYFNSLYSSAGVALVNNDGVHASWPATSTVSIAAAASYPISITFFEKEGGETMKVYWAGPGIERQLIPDTAFVSTSSSLSSGLNYEYYEGNYNSLPDFGSLVPVKTGKTSNVDIGARPAGVNDHFAFIWEGYIKIPTAGTYTFETLSDDGSKLYFNGLYSQRSKALVENDGIHALWPAAGSVTITAAGLYPISISYFEKDGGENMQVYWKGPGIERQLIPDEAFSSGAPDIPHLNRVEPTALSNENLLASEKEEVIIYPNPFKESFNINFYNNAASNKISVGLYDVSGRLIYTYSAGNLAAGNNFLKVNVDNKQVLTGVYFAKLFINGKTAKNIQLVKAKQ